MQSKSTPLKQKSVRELLEWGPIDRRNNWRQLPVEHEREILRRINHLIEKLEESRGLHNEALRAVSDLRLENRNLQERIERLQAWGLACEEHIYATDKYNPNRDYSDFSPGEFRNHHLEPGDLPDDDEHPPITGFNG